MEEQFYLAHGYVELSMFGSERLYILQTRGNTNLRKIVLFVTDNTNLQKLAILEFCCAHLFSLFWKPIIHFLKPETSFIFLFICWGIQWITLPEKMLVSILSPIVFICWKAQTFFPKTIDKKMIFHNPTRHTYTIKTCDFFDE